MKLKQSFLTLLALMVVASLAFYFGAEYRGESGQLNIVNTNSGPAFQGGFRVQETHSGSQTVNNSGNSDGAKRAATEAVLGNTITVETGELIQDAVNSAASGDTILVMPGRYSETLYIDKDNIHLKGIIQNGKRAHLDGEGRLNDAILYSGNNIIIEGFYITNYKGNGVMGQAGNNFEIRNNIVEDAEVYGIFPQLGQNGIIEHNVLSGIADAAIYVGMSDNIHVANNEVFDSVAGIEIENSRHVIVENNYAHHNTGGVLAFITPGLPIKTAFDIIIRNNFIVDNNTENFGAVGSTVSGIPAGTGILVMAADEVIIEGNIIRNHKTAGIIVTDHANAENITADTESEPNPDKISILDNLMSNNGYEVPTVVKAYMVSKLISGEPDIIAIGGGKGSCINNRHRYTAVGINEYKACDFTHTANIDNYLLAEPAPARTIAKDEQGKITYLGICTGCHSYTGRLIGPPIQTIQALYRENPQGLADYIADPIKKRDDYPEMPPQDYLDPQVRLAVAKYVLEVDTTGE